ncbi:MFS transporter [Saccharothrix sp. S26]|uniref:MFS transporter n=1 Tax=Saccharothrix sp. S26 TaxID=2907215 RepID=UPI001F2C73C7|nr:MFS transporter [Saccharothrix sp. S26]MCE6998288.1 MFS transporter [Saccharothrix sp. S26]
MRTDDPIDPDAGHPRRRPALAVLCAALVVTTLDNTVLNTALPAIADDLRASTADLQWINNAYTLVFAALLIAAGGLGARFGQRRALVGGLVVLAAGSAAAATAASAGQLIAWRAVMGLGAAFVMPATLSIIVTIFGTRERGRAIAVWSASAAIGIVLGPVTGGLLLEHFAWGSVFSLNVPLIAAVLAAALALVPALPGRPAGRFDALGLLLCTTGLAALVDVVVRGPERGWLTGWSLAEAGAAAVLLTVFAWWELRIAQPMVDLRMFTRRTFTVAGVLLAVTFFALFGLLFVYTQYLQLVRGYSPLKAGSGALPFAVAMALAAGTSDRVVVRLGVRRTITGGLAVMAFGLGCMSFATTTTAFVPLALVMAVIGAGMGLVMAPSSTASMAALPREKASMASAMNSVTRELGGVLGIAVIGTVVSAAYRAESRGSLPTAPDDLTSAHLTADALPSDQAGALVRASDAAFTNAMNVGTTVCAVVALLGALAALSWLDGRKITAGPGAAPAAAEPPSGTQTRQDVH